MKLFFFFLSFFSTEEFVTSRSQMHAALQYMS